jgi:hypothetical protein
VRSGLSEPLPNSSLRRFLRLLAFFFLLFCYLAPPYREILKRKPARLPSLSPCSRSRTAEHFCRRTSATTPLPRTAYSDAHTFVVVVFFALQGKREGEGSGGQEATSSAFRLLTALFSSGVIRIRFCFESFFFLFFCRLLVLSPRRCVLLLFSSPAAHLFLCLPRIFSLSLYIRTNSSTSKKEKNPRLSPFSRLRFLFVLFLVCIHTR